MAKKPVKTNSADMTPKDALYYQVLSATLALDSSKGHLKWKMTDVARASGVSRQLIYYYFGKSKQGLLLEAVRFLGNDVTGLTPEKLAAWSRGEILETFLHSRELIAKIPGILAFYFRHREQASEIGEQIRLFEKQQRKKVREFFPHLSPDQVELFFAVSLGLLFAPDLSKSAIALGVKSLGF